MDFDEDHEYLNLDDILTHAQTVNCKFLLNIPGLEFLSPGETNDEVTQGTDILLPFWLAKTLYTYSMIDITLPKHYKPNFLEIMQAGADVVDLHRAGPYYYSFGKQLIRLRREKGNDLSMYTEEGQRNKYRREEGETLVERRVLAASLIETFHQRRHKLFDYSTNTGEQDENHTVRQFERRLDNMEKRLFILGRQQVEELKKWNSSQFETLRNNLIASKLSKRRKIECSLTNK